ncbi:MAG: hypothetical protein GQ552_04160 [Flavobacteriaceae bacterium]|nr:hypothetical protein [Flavobacteriaceae bacterium]
MKKVKLLFFTFLIVILSNSIYSQKRGNGSNQSNQNMSSAMKTMPIKPENMAGILLYDTDEVIKKLKIKESPKQVLIEDAIDSYNNNISEVKAFNNQLFDEVKIYLGNARNEAKINNDKFLMKEASQNAKEMLKPVQEKVKKHHEILNFAMENILTDKQFSKWNKYQKKKFAELKPSSSNNSQMKSGGKGSGQGKGRNSY